MLPVRLALILTLLAAVAIAPASRAGAAEPAAEETQGNAPMPETLIIGYENEGQIDASEKACRAWVTEEVEWDKEATENAIADVCAFRKKHVDAYVAFQAAYAKFRSALMQQIRFDGAAAARHLAQIVKSCIDMKWELSTGGHNVGIDMVPNDIDAQCLTMGREIVVKETARLAIDEPRPRTSD